VKPTVFTGVTLAAGSLELRLPPKSVAIVELR
jgi:hypothetical protein